MPEQQWTMHRVVKLWGQHASHDLHITKLRVRLESWLAELPEDKHRRDIEARLKSRLASDHLSAVQELALHHEFLRQGYGVERHPAMPDSRCVPDFRIIMPWGSAIVEAVVASDPGVRQERDHRLRQLLDDIQSVHSGLHLIAQLGGEMPHNFPSRRVRAFLEREIAAGWPDTDDPRTFRDASGLEIDFWTLQDESSVQSGVRGYWLGVEPLETPERIRLSLEEKARKYGKLSEPFVVSLFVCTDPRGLRFELAALYGSDWTIHRGTGEVHQGRNLDGFFVDDSGERLHYTDVSAVLVLAERWGREGIEHVFRVLHNPYAIHPLPTGAFSDWPQLVLQPPEVGIAMAWQDPPGPPLGD